MPSAFQSYFKEVGFPTLLEQFGEPIVYHFVDGGSRSVTAIINRDPPAAFSAGGEVIQPKFTVRLISDCKIGVLPNEVNTGGDYAEFVEEIGDAVPKRKAVMVKLRSGTGVCELAVE